MLTHSSGLKAYEQYYLDTSVNNYNDIIKDITTKQKLSTKPGSKFIYSDLGMILLMDIAQIVTGRKFENLVQSWILNPINMKNSEYNQLRNLVIVAFWNKFSKLTENEITTIIWIYEFFT